MTEPAQFYDKELAIGWNEQDGPYWQGRGDSIEERLFRVIEAMAALRAEAQGFLVFAKITLGERNAAREMIAERNALLCRWAALDGGAWHVERHAREKATLLADTRAALAACDAQAPA